MKSGTLKLQKRRLDSRGKALRPTPVATFDSEKNSNLSKSELPDEPVFEKTLLRSTPQIILRIKDVASVINNNKDNVDAQTEGFGVFSTEVKAFDPQSIGNSFILTDFINNDLSVHKFSIRCNSLTRIIELEEENDSGI